MANGKIILNFDLKNWWKKLFYILMLYANENISKKNWLSLFSDHFQIIIDLGLIQ